MEDFESDVELIVLEVKVCSFVSLLLEVFGSVVCIEGGFWFCIFDSVGGVVSGLKTVSCFLRFKSFNNSSSFVVNSIEILFPKII